MSEPVMKRGTRVELAHTLPNWGAGAELGVFQGAFARELLRRARPAMLHLVDLFAGVVTSGDENGQNLRTVDMEVEYRRLKHEFFGEPVLFHKGRSWEWLIKQAARSLDWVYIDTDHSYETTVKELAAAAAAVKVGGQIAGHDFHPCWFPGVVKAVTEFCVRNELEWEVWCGDTLPSYRIVNR